MPLLYHATHVEVIILEQQSSTYICTGKAGTICHAACRHLVDISCAGGQMLRLGHVDVRRGFGAIHQAVRDTRGS